jgi:hypothetical protein
MLHLMGADWEFIDTSGEGYRRGLHSLYVAFVLRQNYLLTGLPGMLPCFMPLRGRPG